MKVKDFIENINTVKLNKDEVVTRKYIPFVEKVQLIDALIDVVGYEDNGLLIFDTLELDMNKDIAIIKAYTNLEFENGVSDYDALLENSLVSHIWEMIGIDGYRLNDMFSEKLRDVKQQNNSLESIVNKKLGIVVDALTETITSLNGVLSKTDTKKLNGTIAKGIKDIIGSLQQR